MAESERWKELKLLERGGCISGLCDHPVFELQPAFIRGNKKYRPITYEADFQYLENNKMIVEDYKGFRTQAYLLKKKMFIYKYPNIVFRETYHGRRK